MSIDALDRWAEEQVAYGSPDYVRGYRDGIDDAIQAARDLDVLDDRSWWANYRHTAVVRVLHNPRMDTADAAAAVVAYLGDVAAWWPTGCDHRRLALAAASTLKLRQAEERDLRTNRNAARAQYLVEHGVTW